MQGQRSGVVRGNAIQQLTAPKFQPSPGEVEGVVREIQVGIFQAQGSGHEQVGLQVQTGVVEQQPSGNCHWAGSGGIRGHAQASVVLHQHRSCGTDRAPGNGGTAAKQSEGTIVNQDAAIEFHHTAGGVKGCVVFQGDGARDRQAGVVGGDADASTQAGVVPAPATRAGIVSKRTGIVRPHKGKAYGLSFRAGLQLHVAVERQMRGVVAEQQAPAVRKIGAKGHRAAHRPFGVSGQLQGRACGGERPPVVVQTLGELQDAVAQVEFRSVFQSGSCGQMERAASGNDAHVLKLDGFGEGHVRALRQENPRASSGVNGSVVGCILLGFLFRNRPSSGVVRNVLFLFRVRSRTHALLVTNEGALVGIGHQFQVGAGGRLLPIGASADMVGGPLADRDAQDACIGVLIIAHHRLNAPITSKRLFGINKVGVFRVFQSSGVSGEVFPMGTQVGKGSIVTDPHRPTQRAIGQTLPTEGFDHRVQLHGGGGTVQGGFFLIAQAPGGQFHLGGAEREREAVGQNQPQAHRNVAGEGDISRQLEIGFIVGGEVGQIQIAAELQAASGKVEGVAIELQVEVSGQAQQPRHRQWHLQVQGGVLQDQSCVLLRGKSGFRSKSDDAAAGNDPAGKHVDRAIEGQVRLTRVESVCPRIVEGEALADGQVSRCGTQQQAVRSQLHRLEREGLSAGDGRIGVEGQYAGFVKRQPVKRQRTADLQASSGKVERVAVEREGGVMVGAQRSGGG